MEKLTNVDLLPIASLEPWPENYRHGDVKAIKLSIQRFGFNGALRIRGHMVYAGNHQLLALKELAADGLKRPYGISADPSGDWLVPCISIDHLDQTEATAFAIADNRASDLARNDDEALSMLLSELGATTDLLVASGYDDNELKRLLDSLTPIDTSRSAATDNDGQDSLDTEPGIIKCPACGEEFKP